MESDIDAISVLPVVPAAKRDGLDVVGGSEVRATEGTESAVRASLALFEGAESAVRVSLALFDGKIELTAEEASAVLLV